MLDDRGERPGAMFADWELIGVPHRVVISDRGLKEGSWNTSTAATPQPPRSRLPRWLASSRANCRRESRSPWPVTCRRLLAAVPCRSASGLARPHAPAARRKKRWPIRCGWRCRAPSPTRRRPSRRIDDIDQRIALPALAGRDVARGWQSACRDRQVRMEFLETVWYEATRAGLATRPGAGPDPGRVGVPQVRRVVRSARAATCRSCRSGPG